MTMASEKALQLSSKNVSFDVWMKALKEGFENKHGVSTDDLPDQDFLSLYEDELTVAQAIIEVRDSAEDDDGVDFGDSEDDDDWEDDDDEE